MFIFLYIGVLFCLVVLDYLGQAKLDLGHKIIFGLGHVEKILNGPDLDSSHGFIYVLEIKTQPEPNRPGPCIDLDRTHPKLIASLQPLDQ